MTAIIRVKTLEAVLTNGEWTSDNLPLLKTIDNIRRLYESGGQDPNPEEGEARFVAKKLGGRLISSSRVDYRPDVDY